MAELPPGWTADYDGQRWFFTYGPTGQSQLQFPRPGDEFPDFWCCAGVCPAAAALLLAVELMPEGRLESERQVRRMLNASGGSGGASSTVEVEVEEEKGHVRRRASPESEGGGGDSASDVCFESFAAVKSRRRPDLGSSSGGERAMEQREHGVGDGTGMPTRTSVADHSEESTGEPDSVSLVTRGEHFRANSSPPHRSEGSITTIAIMSEPVLAVVETTPDAPSLGHQGQHQPAAAARSSSPEMPMLDGRATESTLTALTALSAECIPELSSESTALCEVEINPPPVELPGDDGGWSGGTMASNMATQNPIELPAYEGQITSSGSESSTAELEPKSFIAMTRAGGDAATSRAGPDGTGGSSRGYDRASLPSQAPRASSKITPGETSRHDSVDSVPSQRPPTRDNDQAADNFGTEQRDLTHFPSVLRPGPRRSSQPPIQQARAVVPAPVINTSRAARARQEHPHGGSPGAEPVRRGGLARMPAMPALDHPLEASETASTTTTTSPGLPRADGARQNRLAGSVNFVIPIQHISGVGSPSAQDITATMAGGSTPRYHVGASFATATSSEEPLRAWGQTAGGSPEMLLSGGKSEPWGQPTGEVAVSARVVSGRSAPDVPVWS